MSEFKKEFEDLKKDYKKVTEDLNKLMNDLNPELLKKIEVYKETYVKMKQDGRDVEAEAYKQKFLKENG